MAFTSFEDELPLNSRVKQSFEREIKDKATPGIFIEFLIYIKTITCHENEMQKFCKFNAQTEFLK